MKQFYLDTLDAGKDRQLLELLYYRVAADHHIANPTRVKLYISKSISYGERTIMITLENVIKLLRTARELLDTIERM